MTLRRFILAPLLVLAAVGICLLLAVIAFPEVLRVLSRSDRP